MFASNKNGAPSQEFLLQGTEIQLQLALAKRELFGSWKLRKETSKLQEGEGCSWHLEELKLASQVLTRVWTLSTPLLSASLSVLAFFSLIAGCTPPNC